jgi:hypothetical protein
MCSASSSPLKGRRGPPNFFLRAENMMPEKSLYDLLIAGGTQS